MSPFFLAHLWKAGQLMRMNCSAFSWDLDQQFIAQCDANDVNWLVHVYVFLALGSHFTHKVLLEKMEFSCTPFMKNNALCIH